MFIVYNNHTINQFIAGRCLLSNISSCTNVQVWALFFFNIVNLYFADEEKSGTHYQKGPIELTKKSIFEWVTVVYYLNYRLITIIKI